MSGSFLSPMRQITSAIAPQRSFSSLRTVLGSIDPRCALVAFPHGYGTVLCSMPTMAPSLIEIVIISRCPDWPNPPAFSR